MAGLGIQTRGTGIARVQKKGGGIAQRGMGAAFKKGGMAMDESMAHEGAESMGMESKETRMEKKGFKEIKSGKMVKEKMAKGGLTTPTIPPSLKKGMKKLLHLLKQYNF